jgi:hypothetical protein
MAYAALRAGPRATSVACEPANMAGSFSRSETMLSRRSCKLTSNSSGNGRKVSSTSGTTIICGVEPESE